jgi:hypothetical protein
MQNGKCNKAKCRIMQDARCKMQDARWRCKMQYPRCKMQDARCSLYNAKSKMRGRLSPGDIRSLPLGSCGLNYNGKTAEPEVLTERAQVRRGMVLWVVAC